LLAGATSCFRLIVIKNHCLRVIRRSLG
jgi:hypothetical protein